MKNKLVFPDARRPLLFGHRGVSSLAPENTLAAFKKIRDMGIPGVELDVHLTKTGEVVVIHDESIKRTGRIFDPAAMNEPIAAPDITIEESAWTDLQQYDFGVWFSKDFAGEKLPLLSEVLELLGPKIYVDIEIKNDTFRCLPLVKKTVEVLENALKKQPQNPNRFLASSFNPLAVQHFSKLSNIPTALIYDSDPSAPFYIRGGKGRFFCSPDVLKPCWKDFRPQRNKNKRKATEQFLWTVDTLEKARELIAAGAAGIISNRPQDIIF